jgi:integrase
VAIGHSERPKPRRYPVRDTRWLEQRGQTWYAVMAVPRPMWASVGKRRLIKSLGTRDLSVAIARRHAALAQFQATFDVFRRQAKTDDLTTGALLWRETFQAFGRGDFSGFSAGCPDGSPGEADDNDKRSIAESLFYEEVDVVATHHGASAARAFKGIAHGTATPLLMHVDAWLREGGAKGPLNPRTATQYRSDINRLAKWAAARGVTTIEGMTEAVAGRYVTEELVARGIHWATANRKITAVASYWRWLRKRAGVKAHPWAGQSMAKGAARRGAKAPKRPFTDAEVATLLAGDADAELSDAMRVAALSGMRIEEIYRLTVADCTGGWFDVRASKTAAGVRRVPIHSDLQAVISRRVAGKTDDGFLFHEPGPTRQGRERSAAISKAFGRYRQRLGVHDRAEGVRHSRVDFHSWRRWFVTQARNAGVDRAVVAAVVGHEAGNLTDDTYSGGPNERLLRACVEAVCLQI